MRPLLQKEWWVLTCVTVVIASLLTTVVVALLTFVATSFLFIRLAINNPAVILNADHFSRIAYLELTKKLILKKDVNGCTVYIYGEMLDFSGKTTELTSVDRLETIVEQALNDFPGFVSERHKLIIPRKKIKRLVMVLASDKHFKSFELVNGTSVSAFVLDVGLLKSIYLKASSSYFDIAAHKATIRHEVFHWIALEYGLDNFFPHDTHHGDAYDFSNLR